MSSNTTRQHLEEETADYEKTIRVQGTPDALLAALTDPVALTAWWTPASGSAEQGGEIVFSFPDPLFMHVDRADPSMVQWTVEECGFLPDWVGTRPTFAMTPMDSSITELRFRHEGLTSELDCIEMCTRGWDHFIASLGRYVETGHGMPNDSPEDQARRVHEHAE